LKFGARAITRYAPAGIFAKWKAPEASLRVVRRRVPPEESSSTLALPSGRPRESVTVPLTAGAATIVVPRVAEGEPSIAMANASRVSNGVCGFLIASFETAPPISRLDVR
jgi:hypothetical protein